MNDDLLSLQRDLRHRLFEGPGAIRWRPGRELAAQLLLYLDDPVMCWRLTTEWMRDTLDADRVDGGFGGHLRQGQPACDYVVLAEAQRASLCLPSVLGWRFRAGEPGLRLVWDADMTAIPAVSQDRGMSQDMRGALHSVGTAAKLALPLRDGSQPVGLICADWHGEAPRWQSEACQQLGGFAQAVLGPVLAGSARLVSDPPKLHGLTPGERRVAHLAAAGLSYKEMARELGRSVSTVDHQLRSIRQKLDVPSTARLVRVLGDLLGTERAVPPQRLP